MEVFEGGSLEQRVMEKVGCVDYSVTPWESVKSDVFQRQVHYKFNKHLSSSGGEVTTTQQRSPLSDNRNGWVVEEVMALQGVLLGDYFNVRKSSGQPFIVDFFGVYQLKFKNLLVCLCIH